MITLPIGIAVLISTFVYLLLEVDLATLVNMHSIVIVCFGTVGILFLSIPLRNTIGLMRSVRDLRITELPNKVINKTILEIARNRQKKQPSHIHPLINYIQDLWQQGLESDLIAILLTQRLEELNARSEQPVASLRNLAKYPPALGMTGTVIGMITLFASLDKADKGNIGSSLAFAMTATFFGLVIANFIILPIADRVHIRHLSRVKRNELVYHSLLLINQNEPAGVIENCHRVNTPYEKVAA
jgi:chemotaxis protein MotA